MNEYINMNSPEEDSSRTKGMQFQSDILISPVNFNFKAV